MIRWLTVNELEYVKDEQQTDTTRNTNSMANITTTPFGRLKCNEV